ncbi:MAG: dihydroorotate dehydrogenase electron transfer subunit [Candidatus Heimdallarchaeota archaeon]
MHTPIPSPIVRVIVETPSIKTFKFQNQEIAERAKPGQFLMMWIPGIDEKPMSLSHIGRAEDHWTIWLTVANIGKTTAMLHSFQEGTLLGLRGPFGNGFTIRKEINKSVAEQTNFLVVGGGYGAAALRPLIYSLLEQGKNLTYIIGAPTKEEVLFKSEYEKLSQKEAFEYLISTEDGSIGFHGTVTQLMRKELTHQRFQQVFTCGPELMMKRTYDLACQHKIPIQASLSDRIIKCAIGLCGQCVLDPIGVRLCIEGPVFSEQELAMIVDFGRTTRNKAGTRISFQ